LDTHVHGSEAHIIIELKLLLKSIQWFTSNSPCHNYLAL